MVCECVWLCISVGRVHALCIDVFVHVPFFLLHVNSITWEQRGDMGKAEAGKIEKMAKKEQKSILVMKDTIPAQGFP